MFNQTESICKFYIIVLVSHIVTSIFQLRLIFWILLGNPSNLVNSFYNLEFVVLNTLKINRFFLIFGN